MKIPKKENITKTNTEDPLDCYYYPLIGLIYKQRLQMALKMISGKKYENLLEIGYGSGVLFPELNGLCSNLHAIDTHDNTEAVKKMMECENIKGELLVGDMLNMPYEDEKFDCIVCLSVLEHIGDVSKAINEINRVLKPGGVAVFGFPAKNKLMDWGFNILGFNHSEHHISSHRKIISEIKKGFSEVKISKFPPFLPDILSMYITEKCEKRI